MLGSAFWEVAWDLVRLLVIPVAGAAAIYGVKWLHLQVQKTALGRRLKVDDLAMRQVSKFIVEAEHLFGRAKSQEAARDAKEMVMRRFVEWLKAARLEDYYTVDDASAVTEWILDRLGLWGQRKQGPTLAVPEMPTDWDHVIINRRPLKPEGGAANAASEQAPAAVLPHLPRPTGFEEPANAGD